jgi:hypothetical protein
MSDIRVDTDGNVRVTVNSDVRVLVGSPGGGAPPSTLAVKARPLTVIPVRVPLR